MLAEQGRGKGEFVARQVDRHQVIAVRQQRIQFAVAGFGVVGAAHDADDLRADPGIAFRRHDAVGHGLDHAFRMQSVGFGHEPGAEPQLDVVDALPLCVLHVLVGHAPAGIQIVQDGRQVPEPPDEVQQAGRPALDDDIRTQ